MSFLSGKRDEIRYAPIDSRRQAEIMRELAKPKRGERTDAGEIAKAVVRELAKQNEFGKTRS